MRNKIDNRQGFKSFFLSPPIKPSLKSAPTNGSEELINELQVLGWAGGGNIVHFDYAIKLALSSFWESCGDNLRREFVIIDNDVLMESSYRCRGQLWACVSQATREIEFGAHFHLTTSNARNKRPSKWKLMIKISLITFRFLLSTLLGLPSNPVLMFSPFPDTFHYNGFTIAHTKAQRIPKFSSSFVIPLTSFGSTLFRTLFSFSFRIHSLVLIFWRRTPTYHFCLSVLPCNQWARNQINFPYDAHLRGSQLGHFVFFFFPIDTLSRRSVL